MSTRPSAIILDVDGVLLDSNTLKEQNIRKAASTYADEALVNEFVAYFTGLNGVPREGKIEKYFGVQSPVSAQLLNDYNRLNEESLKQVPLTEGAPEFLNYWFEKVPLYAVSGGAEEEVRMALHHAGIGHFFTAIYGGPSSKSDNIQRFYQPDQTYWFFGDSKHDHQVALEFNIPFIFLSHYTQFSHWQAYFRDFPEVAQYIHLAHWLNQHITQSQTPSTHD